jgi:hypothetical protein
MIDRKAALLGRPDPACRRPRRSRISAIRRPMAVLRVLLSLLLLSMAQTSLPSSHNSCRG